MHRPPNAIVNLKLRFEERLRRQLEQAARSADRSMNSEIIDRLEKSFGEPALLDRIKVFISSSNEDIAGRLSELQSALNKLGELQSTRNKRLSDPLSTQENHQNLKLSAVKQKK